MRPPRRTERSAEQSPAATVTRNPVSLIEGGRHDRYRERPARPRKAVLDGRQGIYRRQRRRFLPGGVRPRDGRRHEQQGHRRHRQGRRQSLEEPRYQAQRPDRAGRRCRDPQLRSQRHRTMASPTPRWSAPATPSGTTAGRWCSTSRPAVTASAAASRTSTATPALSTQPTSVHSASNGARQISRTLPRPPAPSPAASRICGAARRARRSA